MCNFSDMPEMPDEVSMHAQANRVVNVPSGG